MPIYEQKFWDLLNEFEDLQQQKRDKAKSPWHKKPSRGGDAMNQHQVAMRYQGRYTGDKEFTRSGELNSKIESIRSRNTSMQILSDVDLKHIMNNYKIKELPKDKPKVLFSGVIIYWDPVKDKYILKRDE